jgi:hypothetical protein
MPPKSTPDAPIKLSFSKGIDESQEISVLPEGFLVSCSNWVPEPTGGIRPRVAWVGGPNQKAVGELATYPTTKKIRGLTYVSGNVAGTAKAFWVVGLENPQNSDHNELWAIEADLATAAISPSGGWTNIHDNMGVIGSSFDTYPVAFAKAKNNLVISNPDFTNLHKWALDLTVNAVVISGTMGDPGRALAFWQRRTWSGGGLAKPYRLYYSALDDAETWTTGTDYQDVGQDDGTAIEDLEVFANALMIGKSSGVWIMTGTVDNPTFTEIVGASCSPGRSLVKVPQGMMILGRSEAWLWRGGDPVPISPPVQATYNGYGSTWRMGAHVAGKVFVSGNGANQPVLVFDLDSGAWSTEDGGTDAERAVSLTAYQNRLAMGQNASVFNGPLNYRDHPHGARGLDFDFAGPPITYSAQIPDLWLTEMRQQMTLKALWLQVRQYQGTIGPGVANDLTVTPRVDGKDGNPQTIAALPGTPIVYWVRLPLGAQSGRSIGAKFSTTSVGEGTVNYGIEDFALEIDVSAPRP